MWNLLMLISWIDMVTSCLLDRYFYCYQQMAVEVGEWIAWLLKTPRISSSYWAVHSPQEGIHITLSKGLETMLKWRQEECNSKKIGIRDMKFCDIHMTQPMQTWHGNRGCNEWACIRLDLSITYREGPCGSTPWWIINYWWILEERQLLSSVLTHWLAQVAQVNSSKAMDTDNSG